MSRSQGRRERDLSCRVPFGKIYRNGVQWSTGPHASLVKGRQITVSEDHRRDRNTGRYVEGGPFFTVRISIERPSREISMKVKSSGNTWLYQGPIYTPLSGLQVNSYGGHSLPSEDSSYLDPIGAEAISIIDPLDPNANTGIALGEILKDRRLSIPGIQAWKRRTAVFGWLPLLNDIKDTGQSIRDGNTILENYRNASGTFVHREFEFPHIINESSSVRSTTARASYASNLSVGAFNDHFVECTRTRVSKTRRWFSGSFTYQANESGNRISKALGIGSEVDKLFGLSLNPELLWELTPWSWAIDWFSNAGNVISNINAFKLAGLVMSYGYIMEETSIVDTYTIPDTGLTGVDGTAPPATVTYTVKRRREANPFGFGLSWDGLSPTQLAITAALGITRLR